MNGDADVADLRALGFWAELKEQRWDDHRLYHHSRINQSLHLVSALSFLTSYVLLAVSPGIAALLGWFVAMWSRQIGHFFFEPKDYDEVNQLTHARKEEIKVGYNLRRKIVLLAIWALSPLLLLARSGARRVARGAHRLAELRRQRRRHVARARRRRDCCSAPCSCSSFAACKPGSSGARRS